MSCLKANTEGFVICPCCGSKMPKKRFCDECGQELLTDLKPSQSVFTPAFRQQKHQNRQSACSDEGLTLLVDVCKKTLATVGGDGYSEIVLYQNEKTGEYSIHTYSKYVGMKKEEHASYATSKELALCVLNYIKERDIVSLKDNKGIPLCGADYILKFREGEELIRLDSGKMNGDFSAYADISTMLYNAIAKVDP